MCGVFGFISDRGRLPNMKRLRDIAVATERRGRHAFGFAWVDGAGRLRYYKKIGRISENLETLAMLADARMLIGHCRHATAGDPMDNINNHPHPADGGWIIHNGQIPNCGDLYQCCGLRPSTDCDSEVLGLLIESQSSGSLRDRCTLAVQAIDEDSPAVMLGIWSRPGRLVAIKRGKPLMIGQAATGIYLASLRSGLPMNARDVADDSCLMFNQNKEGACDGSETTIEIAEFEHVGGRAGYFFESQGSGDGVRRS